MRQMISNNYESVCTPVNDVFTFNCCSLNTCIYFIAAALLQYCANVKSCFLVEDYNIMVN